MDEAHSGDAGPTLDFMLLAGSVTALQETVRKLEHCSETNAGIEMQVMPNFRVDQGTRHILS
jgi:hypothetical protein